MPDQPGYTTLELGADTVALPGGQRWTPVRRRLGIGAFGVNHYSAAAVGDVLVEEHVESPGQEELYVVLDGRALFTVDEERVEVAAGTAIFVPDPQSRRGATAVEAPASVVAVGGWTDKPYHALAWEPIYLATDAIDKGDWHAAAETLEREAGPFREHPFVAFRLACCLAQLGETERAYAELKVAVSGNAALAERARESPLLAELDGLEAWLDERAGGSG